MDKKTTILITGAGGNVGKVLREDLARSDRILRLNDIHELGPERDGEEHVIGDARDPNLILRATKDIDAAIHLAAYPDEAPWEKIFPLNYELTYQFFEACRINNVKRVLFASSIQALGFHSLEKKIDDTARLRPGGFYGVSKGFGEAMASLYADKHGLSVACLRIASFEKYPSDKRHLSTWLSHEDGVQLFERCLEASDFHFIRVFGVSNNTRSKVDNSHVDWLGFKPVSNAEDFVDEIMKNDLPIGPLAVRTHGGTAADIGFSGDAAKTFSSD